MNKYIKIILLLLKLFNITPLVFVSFEINMIQIKIIQVILVFSVI